MKKNEIFWPQKHRPKTLDDCVFKPKNEKIFKGIIEYNEIPNLLLYGLPGLGKTTISLILPDLLDYDYLMLNARTDGNIDKLKTDVTGFIETKSFNGRRKLVIFDEGDAASLAVLDALKTMIEKYSSNASFIITSNHVNKFSDALRSRFILVDFTYTQEDKKYMIKKMYMRILKILKSENVQCEDNKALVNFISDSFPDFRHILKHLQIVAISNNNIITPEDLNAGVIFDTDEFVTLVKRWNYTDLARYVENKDYETLFLFLENNMNELVKPENYFDFLKIINSYSYQGVFTSTKFANTMACIEDIKEFIK